MTLPSHPSRPRPHADPRPTLAVVSLLLLFGAGCDTTDSETSPTTPDTQPPTTSPPAPTPPPPPPSPPDTPTGLRIVGEGATETHMFLDLEWDAVPDADLYRLDIDWDERCRFFPDRLKDPSQRAHGPMFIDFLGTATNLEVLDTRHRALLARQQSDYCFRIRAERESGEHSPWSSTVTGRTPKVNANRIPDAIGTSTIVVGEDDSLSGLVHRSEWRRVAGAYGYLYQRISITTRSPDNLISPIEETPPYWWASPILTFEVPIGNWHGCAAYARICSIYDENLALDAIARRGPRNRREPDGCSGWSETQKVVIEIPGETLPPFRCRNAGPLNDAEN